METWFLLLIPISVFGLFKLLNPTKRKLPPGPLCFPIIGNLLWLRKSLAEIEPILKDLHAKYGAIVTLHIGSRPSIYIADRTIAHQTLVQNGAVFADRPPALAVMKIISCNQHNINTAFYGPTWRLLRRNLSSEIFHPSRVKSFAHARKYVLEILCNRFESAAKSGDSVRVISDFQYAMFCLLNLMCFGDKLDDQKIQAIVNVLRRLLLSGRRFNSLNFWPRLGKILFRKLWQELYDLRKNQEDMFIPLIRARKNKTKDDKDFVSYVDTLFDLNLPNDNRKLTEGEIVTLCSEFLNAGTDTTSTALQWIMANLVKYPEIQENLIAEMKSVLEPNQEDITESDLQKLPYLKAVILEGLRRHPPGHFVLPHAVTKDVELEGYVIPKNGTVNFMVAEMGWDSKVWEDPMAFRPERFMNENAGEVFDVMCSREIKMMPFGAGRRICPGYSIALLHLEYFVGNLVWKFGWSAVVGDDVDLAEKQEFTVVMEKPLEVKVSFRSK